MFLEIILALLLGIFAGTITGLIPGLHINLVAIFIVAFASYLFQFINPIYIILFIISMSITHTFVDAIPGIYLGAPDESQALSALPGHRLLLKGEGHNALKLTVIGSFMAIIFGILSFPIFIKSINTIYPIIKDSIGYVLIGVLIFIISREKTTKKKLNAILIVLLSGTLGISVFYLSDLNLIQQPLLSMLSGLFGLSILITSLNSNTRIPKQNINQQLSLEKNTIKKTTIASLGVGFIAAFLPGFGTSQAAILAKEFVGDLSEKGFLILVGGLNTANMLISLSTFFVLNKARNGAILAVQKLIGNLDIIFLILILFSILFVASIATLLTLEISKKFSKIIEKINYKKLIYLIIIFIFIMVFFFSGIVGILVLLISISLGLFCNYLGVGKNYLTGSLLIPVIFYFIL